MIKHRVVFEYLAWDESRWIDGDVPMHSYEGAERAVSDMGKTDSQIYRNIRIQSQIVTDWEDVKLEAEDLSGSAHQSAAAIVRAVYDMGPLFAGYEAGGIYCRWCFSPIEHSQHEDDCPFYMAQKWVGEHGQ